MPGFPDYFSGAQRYFLLALGTFWYCFRLSLIIFGCLGYILAVLSFLLVLGIFGGFCNFFNVIFSGCFGHIFVVIGDFAILFGGSWYFGGFWVFLGFP